MGPENEIHRLWQQVVGPQVVSFSRSPITPKQMHGLDSEVSVGTPLPVAISSLIAIEAHDMTNVANQYAPTFPVELITLFYPSASLWLADFELEKDVPPASSNEDPAITPILNDLRKLPDTSFLKEYMTKLRKLSRDDPSGISLVEYAANYHNFTRGRESDPEVAIKYGLTQLGAERYYTYFQVSHLLGMHFKHPFVSVN